MEGTMFEATVAGNASKKQDRPFFRHMLFLITRLHDTSPNRPSPAEVEDIQKRIQTIQRAPSGWSVGLDLLANQHSNVRFFGALTLTIKINADWDKDNLAGQDAFRQVLLQKLIERYASLTNAPDVAAVRRKLCSTLVAYFAQPTSEWRLPVRDVLAAIFERGSTEQLQYVTEHGTALASRLVPALRTITYEQLRGILWLGLSLVEDGLRYDLKGVEGAKLVAKITENGEDVWQLLGLALQAFHMRMGTVDTSNMNAVDIGESIHDEELVDVTKEVVLPTALAWMKLAPPEKFESDRATTIYIDRSVALIVRSFQFPVMAKTVLEVLIGMRQSAPGYYEEVGAGMIDNMIESKQSQIWVRTLRNGHFDPDAMLYPEFLVGLVEFEDLSSPKYFVDQKLNKVIHILQLLLQCDGPAMVEDQVCSMVLEAFSQIAEGFVDWTGEHAGNQSVKDLLATVCRSCLSKIQYPVEEMDHSTQNWDPSDRSLFMDFRHDVEDFLLSSFSSLGPQLLHDITDLLTHDPEDSWESFEAGLFCLATLSESMANDPDSYDATVSSIFSTNRWKAIVQNTSPVPSRAGNGAINYISRNTAFLQRHQEQLVPCLDFLFSSLPSRTSSSAASRAIHTLCTTHRSTLVGALPQFIATLTQLPPMPSEDKQRLFGAVAAIVQALPTEDGKLQPLSDILDILSHDFQELISLAGGQQDDILPKALDLLQCLGAIGKGLRTPEDTAVDLDAEDHHPSSQYWKTGPGSALQVRAVDLFSATFTMSNLRSDEQIITAACDFFKAGYTEEDPSPFKFPAEVSLDFLTRAIHLSTPNINVVMATASAFLASSSPDSSAGAAAFPILITAVTTAQRTLLSASAGSQQYADHDFTYSSFDFLVRLLPKWGGQLFELPVSDPQEPLQIVFDFAIAALLNPDTLPRRSSAAFWAALFELGGYPASATLSLSAASTLEASIHSYSARLTAALVRLLGGECARSELEALAEPLRKFVAKQTQLARALLREAITDEAGVLTERALGAVNMARRMRFVTQVEALRGARKTNEVVREFWVACRGSAFGYTA